VAWSGCAGRSSTGWAHPGLLQAPGKEPDPDRAIPLSAAAIEDLAGKIHRDLQRNLKSARVWGKEVFDGQAVGREYVLQDGDVVELQA
jgi:ribosome-interacting GTPase 1